MTLKAVVARALAAACISGSSGAVAGTRVPLSNGVVGDGALTVPIDDFGVWGSLIQQGSDSFQAASSISERATYLAGLILYVETPDAKSTAIAVSDAMAWHQKTESGGQTDGIIGTHTNVARTITQGLTVSGDTGTSAFDITATEFDLQFALTQRMQIINATSVSVLDQKYDITNAGPTSVDVVVHVVWEGDIYFDSPDATNDIVGAVPGLCALYMRDPGGTQRSIALSTGPLATVARTHYYAGKAGTTPPLGAPMYETMAESPQLVINSGGMPASWRDHVTGVGYLMDGEAANITGDATLGFEYHFTIAAGATEVVHVRRQYGSIAVTCPPAIPVGCGDGTKSPDEPCDGADTPTCNGETCLANECGDGHVNTLAGETCEELGDSATCDAQTCTAPVCGDGYPNASVEACDPGAETAECNIDCTPSICGDGYINTVAGEQCELDALCDVVTCQVTYTLGGGCTGCGTTAPSSLWLAGLVLAFSSRRRRRARTA